MYMQAFPWPPKMLQGLQKDPPYSYNEQIIFQCLFNHVHLEKTFHRFFEKPS